MKSGLHDKVVVWLHGDVKTPPFSQEARLEAGFYLRMIQEGERLSMPHSRPMASIGPRCHELRIKDQNKAWRLVYRLDPDAIVILDVFEKKTRKTPKHVIDACRKRIRDYDASY